MSSSKSTSVRDAGFFVVFFTFFSPSGRRVSESQEKEDEISGDENVSRALFRQEKRTPEKEQRRVGRILSGEIRKGEVLPGIKNIEADLMWRSSSTLPIWKSRGARLFFFSAHLPWRRAGQKLLEKIMQNPGALSARLFPLIFFRLRSLYGRQTRLAAAHPTRSLALLQRPKRPLPTLAERRRVPTSARLVQLASEGTSATSLPATAGQVCPVRVVF